MGEPRLQARLWFSLLVELEQSRQVEFLGRILNCSHRIPL